MKASRLQRPERRRGSAVLEAAAVFAGFGLLIFGAIEVSAAAHANNVCRAAARDAARWASLQDAAGDPESVEASVRRFVEARAVGLTPGNLEVVTQQTPGREPGRLITVTVRYEVLPLARMAFGTPWKVGGSAAMPVLR